ncbi:MAG: hypothetical protein ACREJ2_07255 [Planctomycetota bacterium]
MRTPSFRVLSALCGAALFAFAGCGETQAVSPDSHQPPPNVGAHQPANASPEEAAAAKADFVFFNAIGSPEMVHPPEAPWSILEVPDSDAVSNTKVLYLADRLNLKLVHHEIECGGQKDYAFPGTVQYKFTLPKDDHYVPFVHADFQDDCGNSIFIQIDQGPIYRVEYAVAKEFNTEYKWTCPMSEGNPVSYTLAAGPHTLTILNREDGLKIDEILVCSRKLAGKFEMTEAPLKKK